MLKTLMICLSLHPTALPVRPNEVLQNSRSTASLVELYSSEGCSSCPPAEAWINDLKNVPGLWKDIFPVVFHVDYWDGLGWPDRFARAEYTRRQRDYAAQLGQDSVYTPEFIVNGLEWRRSGSGGRSLPPAGAEKTGTLSLTVHEQEKKISALYLPGPSVSKSLVLHVALLGFNVVTEVRGGENSGRTLQHDFVVLGFTSMPMTSAAGGGFEGGPVEIKSSTDDPPRAVVGWVSGGDGAILQVAGGWLSSEDHHTN